MRRKPSHSLGLHLRNYMLGTGDFLRSLNSSALWCSGEDCGRVQGSLIMWETLEFAPLKVRRSVYECTRSGLGCVTDLGRSEHWNSLNCSLLGRCASGFAYICSKAISAWLFVLSKWEVFCWCSPASWGESSCNLPGPALRFPTRLIPRADIPCLQSVGMSVCVYLSI